jgi:hypothetical protein
VQAQYQPEVYKHSRRVGRTFAAGFMIQDGVDILALKLVEASKRHHIRYPIGG